jgi:hypothetical protein
MRVGSGVPENPKIVIARGMWLARKWRPILSGAISVNQHLKCPYLPEILDTV